MRAAFLLLLCLAAASAFSPAAVNFAPRSASSTAFRSSLRPSVANGRLANYATPRNALTALQMAVSLPKGPLTVGICGATGAVGKELIGVLEKRNFPVKELRLFGSERSAGRKVETKFGTVTIEDFSLDRAKELDVVFVSVSGDFSKEWCHKMADGGAVVIDNSSAFRYDKDISLCVPEINADSARKGSKRVIANPNCTTAIGIMALYPLHKAFGLKKVMMSTYQAASGAGAEGMAELFDGIKEVVNGPPGTVAKNKFFAHPLPFNLIPHIDVFQENGYTKEEMKVTWECQKILDLPNLPVSCTSVRIPTLRAHSETMVIETEKEITPAGAREVLMKAPGVKVVDDTANKKYPMPLTASQSYPVEVGRIRQNIVFGKNGLEFFACGDQLLRGAALNAVLIAEALTEPVGTPFNPKL